MRLSKKEFLAILRENAGLYGRTARFIAEKIGIPTTRQAVRDRALRYPEILKDIEEQNVDLAEEGLHSLMRSKNENIRLRAVELYLKTKGRHRGYVATTDLNIDFEKLSNEQLNFIIDSLYQKIQK